MIIKLMSLQVLCAVLPCPKVTAAVEAQRPSLDATLADYVRAFNATDDERYTNAIPNAAAEAFLLKNAPRFACPDADIERTYYFRWWTYRKHLRHTPDGWVVTEFLPDVSWAGRYNTISCALGHHIREGRWLRDRTPLRDYAAFWLRPKDGGRLNGPGAYVSWIADSVLKLADMDGDAAFATNHLSALVRNYEAWEAGWDCRVFPGTGTFPMGLKGGLFETTCNYEGSELALAGDGARPLVNAAMCGEARTIAALAARAGDAATAMRFASKAAALEAAVKERLWDPQRQFFMTVATNGVRGTVKELNGYAPWYFGLDLKGCEAAWEPFADPEGSAAHVRRMSDGRRLPWIDEVQNPDTGDWISRTMLERDPKNRIPERGKDYNHSTFCDLVLGELVGIRPQRDGSLVVAPLFPPAWAYLRVEGVRWRGHDISVVWDRDGTRYGLGAGFFVLRDGAVVSRQDLPRRTEVKSQG